MKYHILFYCFIFILIFAEFSDSSPPDIDNLKSIEIHAKATAFGGNGFNASTEARSDIGTDDDQAKAEAMENSQLAFNFPSKELEKFHYQKQVKSDVVLNKPVNVPDVNIDNRKSDKLQDNDLSMNEKHPLPLSGSIITIFIAGVLAIVAIRRNLNYLS